ncbi:helix-turn-helix domain-containing protein [Nocardioides sp. CER19]|uniref:helix-turn-helix domain-containing protein n=1 Tax=Nocardioides sp. CER19 TaxID=3038538 RepID=UPI00244AEF1E|nr:helix-turn-helix domain-containing protein [Nocardioides sp. CER19]MDH2412847.1 helix-turn-helix domain-containing protein [Nocardioides sp. CER19]
MDEAITRTTPAQRRALGHPTRHLIWRATDSDGATVSQLTSRLRINKGNVAHHVKVLVDVGLLRPDRTRTVRGGTEQYYVKTARRLSVDGDQDATRAMFASIADEVVGAVDPLLNHRTIRLTRRQAQAVAEHLDRVVNELVPAGPAEPTYGVLVGVYRR